MGENEGLDVAKPIRIMGKEIPRSSVEKALYCTGAFLIVFNAFSIPFALPKLRAFLGAPYLPSSSSAFRKVIENVSELQRPGLKLVDIGSGDGRLLVEASRKGMKSMGIEMNPWLVLGSRLRLVLAKANSNSSILWGNAWKSLNPLSRFEPDVVVFYGRTGQGLMSKLGQLSEDISDRTGKDLIVISNKFQIPGWNIRLIAHVDEFFVYRLHSNNRS